MPHPLAAFDLPWRQCGGILVAPAAFWRHNRGPGGIVAAFCSLAALGGMAALPWRHGGILAAILAAWRHSGGNLGGTGGMAAIWRHGGTGGNLAAI